MASKPAIVPPEWRLNPDTEVPVRALGSLCLLALLAAGCGKGDSTSSSCVDPAASPPPVDCGGARCSAIAIAGDAPAGNPGTFRGYADPAIAHEPVAAQRGWLFFFAPSPPPRPAPPRGGGPAPAGG